APAAPLATPAPARAEPPAAPPAAAPVPKAAVPAVPATSTAVPAQAQEWAQRIDAMGLDGMTRQLARHCAWVGESDGVARLALDPRAKHLLIEDRRGAIQRALSAHAGRTLAVEIAVLNSPDLLSPVAADERRVIERQRAAEAAVDNDPTVRAFRESFGASVRPGSIHPLEDADGGA
ncbi:MAG: DNA polymerase III subunit gamma/tau, partial [Nevskia sp.]|nr:DNA polymerase III subunit gamma/tau [Nevskia sp.]